MILISEFQLVLITLQLEVEFAGWNLAKTLTNIFWDWKKEMAIKINQILKRCPWTTLKAVCDRQPIFKKLFNFYKPCFLSTFSL